MRSLGWLLARKRFAADVLDRAAPLLDRIVSPRTFEDLADSLLDAADGAAW